MIPGVPGMFAGCVVEVDDETDEVLSIIPLPRHTAFTPVSEEAAEPTEPIKAEVKQKAETPPPTQEEAQGEVAEEEKEGN
jgi:hypothetical protein